MDKMMALHRKITALEQDRDRLAAQLDIAWQQSAEAMREAAWSTVFTWALVRGKAALLDAIRALPVPERKEG